MKLMEGKQINPNKWPSGCFRTWIPTTTQVWWNHTSKIGIQALKFKKKCTDIRGG